MSQNLEKFGVEAIWYDAKFEKGVKNYNTALKKADAETKKSTDSMAKSWQLSGNAVDKMVSDYVKGGQKIGDTSRKLPQDAKKGARGFSLAFTEIRSAIMLGIGALRTFAQAASAAFQAAREGAAQLGQQRSFAIVSGGAEQAAKNLQAMREATRGTATDAELMESALGILAVGLATNEEELFLVTRNVTTLARTLKGFGSERALMSFQLLATDLEASRQRLDDFGLSYDKVKAKQEAFIASGMDLQEATRTALLEEMSVVMEDLGLNAATTADSFGQATAAAGNLADSFKQALAPAGAVMADAFTAVITGAQDTEEAMDGLARGAIKAAAYISAAAQVISEFRVTNVEEFGGLIATEMTGATNAVTRFDELLQEGMERGAAALNEVKSAGEGVTKTTDDIAESTDEASASLQKFSDTIASARTQALEAFLKKAIATERQLEDAAIARARKVEDIERRAAQRRAQIAAQLTQTISNLQEQSAEQSRTNAINLARQLEQIERNYQERKRAIKQQFWVSFARAVRSRDALALVEAVRTRKSELDEAKRQRNQERTDATTNAAQQEAEQARTLQRQIEAARAAAAQQLIDAEAAQAAQFEAMQRAEARQTEDRARAAARWLEDQTRAFGERRVRAMAEYQQDESIYLAHLQAMLRMTNTYIPSIFRSGAGGVSGGGPRGRRRMAQGGAFVTDGATDITVGEAGREFVMVQPLSQITNVNPVSPQVAGSMRHDIGGEIQASMAGFEGRLTAEVQRAVLDAFGRVLQ